MSRAWVRILTLPACAAVLSGCLLAAEQEESAPVDIQPSATPTEAFEPVTSQPRDTRVVDGGSFTMFAPTAFQQSTRPGPGGVEMVVLSQPARQPGGVIEVIAFEDSESKASPLETATFVTATKQEMQGVEDFTREVLQWPGAQEAVVLQWNEQTSTAGGDITERYAQLIVQAEGSSSTVGGVAVAPQDEFESSGVLDVLRSVTLDGA